MFRVRARYSVLVFYTPYPRKQSQRIFNIILFSTNNFFLYKIWRTNYWVYSGNNCSCIYNESCVIHLPETFYLMFCRTESETQTASGMETSHSIFVATCSHQSVASPSLCLCQGSRWTFRAHFMVFSLFNVLR